MSLGEWVLESIFAAHVQLAAGNAPVTADSAPTFRIYSGTSSSPVATGVASGVVDSQLGWHLLTTSLTVANGFARGVYTLRLSYSVSAVAAVQEYSFQVT